MPVACAGPLIWMMIDHTWNELESWLYITYINEFFWPATSGIQNGNEHNMGSSMICAGDVVVLHSTGQEVGSIVTNFVLKNLQEHSNWFRTLSQLYILYCFVRCISPYSICIKINFVGNKLERSMLTKILVSFTWHEIQYAWNVQKRYVHSKVIIYNSVITVKVGYDQNSKKTEQQIIKPN